MKEETGIDREKMIEALIVSMKEEQKSAEDALCHLLEEVDPEKLLVIMMAQLLSRPAEAQVGDEFGTYPVLIEILAYYALSKVNAEKSRIVTPVDTGECQKYLESLLHSKTFINMGESKARLFKSPAELIKMHSEVVRGNAYPEQTAGKIVQIQGKFDKWFKVKIGISPSRALDIIFGIIKHTEEVLNVILEEIREYSENYIEGWNKEKKEVQAEVDGEQVIVKVDGVENAKAFIFFCKFNEMIPKKYPVKITELDLPEAVTEAEEKALKGLIAISNATFDKVGKKADIRKFPMFELADGRVVLSDFSNAMDFLWEAFESIVKSDQPFYDKRYQKYKAKFVEAKAVTYLKRIFSESAVYQTLDYPDISKNNGSTAELDIAVFWEPFLVLVEVKAKQFRLESQTGNSAKLRSDLKANIEDAHKQALRAIEYIDSTENAEFSERGTGRLLTVERSKIFKTFPVSLSLHQLSSISVQLDKAQELGLFKDGKYPFTICLSDLDLLTRTCISQDVLLHYIEKRILLLNEAEEYHGDELDMFSAYLDTRLHRNNLTESGEKLDLIAFTGYSEKFDQLMLHDRGEGVDKPKIDLNVPDEIDDLLRELRKRNDRGSRLIAFALLELEDSLLNAIAGTISELKSQDIPNGIFRRGTFASDDVAVSIVASNSASVGELYEKTGQRVLIEKYRRKLNKSIAIGIVCQREGQALETANYAEFDWETDPDMETLIEEEAPFIPSPGVKLPGVNQPCICGSGKKFKKCCKRKIEDSRWELSSQ